MFCLSAAVLAAALGLAHLLVPDVVPVAFAEEPQSSWAVMTAFMLRAIELIAAGVAIIALAALARELIRLAWSRASRDRRAPRCRTPHRS
jgi:energy-coupling factor transporter transmembrane protein EcfT